MCVLLGDTARFLCIPVFPGECVWLNGMSDLGGETVACLYTSLLLCDASAKGLNKCEGVCLLLSFSLDSSSRIVDVFLK